MSNRFEIELKNIFIKLNGSYIFKDFSLQLSSEGISVILGENGSGKTVLSKIIKGILDIDKGEILIKKK